LNNKNIFWNIQAYDDKDYRNVRFTNAAKVVNKNWAIDLIAEQPIIESTERVVWCDGGDPHLGHPKVYINLVSSQYFLIYK
jgi:NADH dehydrogenase (ubiquinone) Fe-S protein 6